MLHVMRGESVAVVSSNNSATQNILEKLKKNDVNFIAAYLGSSTNKEAFIESQNGLIPNIAQWKLNYEDHNYIDAKLNEMSQELNKMLLLKNDLSQEQREYEALNTEQKYFIQYYNDANYRDIVIRSNGKMKSSSALKLWIENENRNADIKLSFIAKLIYFFKYGITNFKFYNNPRDQLIAALQKKYYEIQLISVIRSLTNQNEEGKEMEINQLLTSSRENISAALEIEKTINESKQYIIRKVLHTLEERIGKPKLINRFDYEQETSLINDFYKNAKLTCPGISFFYKSDDGIDIWFRIEMGWYLYAGFCISLDKDPTKKKQKELKEIYTEFEYMNDAYWLHCENLPISNGAFIDYKNTKDGFIDLYDPTYFDEYIKKCITCINEMWK